MSERPGSIIQAIADHALAEARELDQEAANAEDRAQECRRRAQVLRDLHSIALPHARVSSIQLEGRG
jgi:homogentisate 1,2-dioxygenase